MKQKEIKFRAWDKKCKEMFRVFMLSYIEGKGLIVSGRGGSIDGEDVELMQFTGLKDKNGKEIYEGDILKWNGEKQIAELRIEFDMDFPWEASEIIGDIYSNPELIK